MRPSRSLFAFLLALAVACSAPTPKRGEVQREWNSTLRELGIQPVYPPREDLQVGDVYVRRGYVDDQKLVPDSGYAPIDLWLASAATGATLDAFYGARAGFPITPGEGAVPASAPAVGAIFTQGDNTRMRVVAFPDFASMNIRAADLRAFIPVEALGLGLGGSWSGKHQVTVKVPIAESCGLPVVEALKLVADDWKLKHEIADADTLAKLHAGVKHWAGIAPGLTEEARRKIADDPMLHLDLVTEVFYTRAIDVAVSGQTSGGARANVAPVGAGAAGNAPLVAPEGDAVARAAKLNEELKKIDELSVPGGSVQFLSASDQALSMQRRFDRPIAIGYRALELSVDPATGVITGLGGAAERVGVVTNGTQVDVATALQNEIANAGLPIRNVRIAVSPAIVIGCQLESGAAATAESIKASLDAKASELAAAARATHDSWEDGADRTLTAFAAQEFTVKLRP